MPEEWQLTLDVIKSKAQNLVMENEGLKTECRQLNEQSQNLLQEIYNQQSKNDQAELYLKERHGRTDQYLRIEELTPIVRKKLQSFRALNDKLEGLKKKSLELDNKIQELKYTISEIQLHQQAEEQKSKLSAVVRKVPVDDQLSKWRKQFEDENKQEVILENELKDLKTGDTKQNLNIDTIDKENKDLDNKLNALRLQKLHHIKDTSDISLAQANARMYAELRKQKSELEANISAYELRMDELKETSLMALSWTHKRKKMIHEMVQADARNNQMRDTIKELHEDIDVLKDQVARLERRVDFAKDQGPKQ